MYTKRDVTADILTSARLQSSLKPLLTSESQRNFVSKGDPWKRSFTYSSRGAEAERTGRGWEVIGGMRGTREEVATDEVAEVTSWITVAVPFLAALGTGGDEASLLSEELLGCV